MTILQKMKRLMSQPFGKGVVGKHWNRRLEAITTGWKSFGTVENSSFAETTTKKKSRKRIKLVGCYDEEADSGSNQFKNPFASESNEQGSEHSSYAPKLLDHLKPISDDFSIIFRCLDRNMQHKALYLLEKRMVNPTASCVKSLELTNIESEEFKHMQLDVEKYTALSIAKICDSLICHFSQTKEYAKLQKVMSILRIYDNSQANINWNGHSILMPVIQKGISILLKTVIDSMRREYGQRVYKEIENSDGKVETPTLERLVSMFTREEFVENQNMQEQLKLIIELSNSYYYVVDVYILEIILGLLIEGKKFKTAAQLVAKENDRLIVPVLNSLSNDNSLMSDVNHFTNSHVYELVHSVLTILGEVGQYDNLLQVYNKIRCPDQKSFNLTIYYLSQSDTVEYFKKAVEILNHTVQNRSHFIHIISPVNIKDIFRSSSIATQAFSSSDIDKLYSLFFSDLNIKYSPRILNIFLNLFLKHGKEDKAIELLKQFNANNILPNISTLTTIMTYLVDRKLHEDAITIADMCIAQPLSYDIPFLNNIWKIYYSYLWESLITTEHVTMQGSSRYVTYTTDMELLDYIKQYEISNFLSVIEWKKTLNVNPLFEKLVNSSKEDIMFHKLKIFEYFVIQMERAFDKYILTTYNYLSDPKEESHGTDEVYVAPNSTRHLRQGTREMDEATFKNRPKQSNMPLFLQQKNSKLIVSDDCRLDLRLLIQSYCIRPRLRQIDDLLQFVSGAYGPDNSLRRYHYLRVIISLLECGHVEHVKRYIIRQFENCKMPIHEKRNTMNFVFKTIRSKFNPSLRGMYCGPWKETTQKTLESMLDLLSIEDWNAVLAMSKIPTKMADYQDLKMWISNRLLKDFKLK